MNGLIAGVHGHLRKTYRTPLIISAGGYVPRYGLYDKTLTKYCKPCKPLRRTANPELDRIGLTHLFTPFN